jgi:hypothetical protein
VRIVCKLQLESRKEKREKKMNDGMNERERETERAAHCSHPHELVRSRGPDKTVDDKVTLMERFLSNFSPPIPLGFPSCPVIIRLVSPFSKRLLFVKS